MPDTPEPKPFERLERKIRSVCLYLSLGRHTRFRWEVTVYYSLRITSIVLSAIAGAGLIADKVSANLTVATGWAFWGALIMLAFSILVQIGDVFGVEKAATHARVLAAQSKLYMTELGLILKDDDPMDSLNGLDERVKTTLLDPNNNSILPDEHHPAVNEKAERLASDLIARNSSFWVSPPPGRVRGGNPTSPPRGGVKG